MKDNLKDIVGLVKARFSSVTDKYDLLSAIEDGVNQTMEENEAMVLMAHILDEFIEIDYKKREKKVNK